MKKILIVLITVLLITPLVFGFGKNKVRYDNFKWEVRETEHFELYYYPEIEPMIGWIANTFESSYSYLSKRYDYELTMKPPVILYLNHRHFEQTNILPGFIPGNVGGFSEIIKKRLVIPVNGSRYSLEKLIIHEMNHLFQFDYFYQNKLQLIGAIPMYVMEGFSESFSYDWDMEGLMVLRDAFLNNNFYTLEQMRNFYTTPNVYLCYKESHAFIDFLIEQYGEEKIKLFMRNIRRNPKINFDGTFKKTYGIGEKELSDIWINYMKKKFWPMIQDKQVPEISYGKPWGYAEDYVVSFKPVYFPSGELFAFITSKNQQLDIYVQGTDTNDSIKRLTEQDSLDYQYISTEGNAIAISPDGDYLAAFARDKSADVLYLINIITEEIKKIELEGFESPTSPSFGSDSKTIVFAGDRDGQTDIWTYNIETDKYTRWTKDNCEDYEPRLTKDMKRIYYVSEIKGIRKIFTAVKGDFNSKTQVTYGSWDDIQPFLSADGKKLLYISGKVDMIPNLFELDFETNTVTQLTNTLGGVFDPNLSPDGKEVLFSCYYNGLFRIYKKPREEFESLDTFLNSDKDEITEFCFFDRIKTKVHKSKKMKFKLEPSYVYSDLAFSTSGELKNYTQIAMSDILENHMFILSVNSIQQFSDSYLVYIFKRYRYNVGAAVFNFSNYYFFPSISEVGLRRYYGGNVFFHYPLDIYNRLELSLNYSETRWDQVFQDYYGLPRAERELSVSLAFVRDTTRWNQFEPIAGARYQLMVKQYFTPGDSYQTLTEYGVDYRNYFRLSRRSSYALRIMGSWSTGYDKYLYFFGGGNTLRGFDYNEFYGTRMAIVNQEFRIPFIDFIRLLGFFDLYYIRGVLYWDLASAWSDDSAWTPAEKDEDGHWRLEDVKSSLGFGLRLRGGYFDFNFYFSKKTDLYQVYPDTIYQFYMGTNF